MTTQDSYCSSVTSSLSDERHSVRFGSVEVRRYSVIESQSASIFEDPHVALGADYEVIGSASIESFEQIKAPRKGVFNFFKNQFAKPSVLEKKSCEDTILAAIEADLNGTKKRSRRSRSMSLRGSR